MNSRSNSESLEIQIGFSSQDICIKVEYKIKEKGKYFEYKIKSFKFINVSNKDEIDFLLAELVHLKNEQEISCFYHNDLIYYYICILLGNLIENLKNTSKEINLSEKLISILAESLSYKFVSNKNLLSAVNLIQEIVLSKYLYLI